MSDISCPHCVGGIMSEVVYSKEVAASGRVVKVEGLLKYVCGTCSGELVSRAQMKSNDSHIGEHIQYTSGQ